MHVLSTLAKMSQIRHAAWAVKADTITADHLCSVFNSIARQWVFQQERGDSGEERFIAYTILNGRIRIRTLIRDLARLHGLESDALTIEAVSEPYLKQHPLELYRFQTRNENYIAGPWSNYRAPVVEVAPVAVPDISDYSPWQRQIWESCVAEPRGQHINLVIDRRNKPGRNKLSEDVEMSRRGVRLVYSDNPRDMQHLSYIKLQGLQDPRCLLIDIPASSCLLHNSDMIQKLKSGISEDTRGRIRQQTFRSPVVWVFHHSRAIENDRRIGISNYQFLPSTYWKLWRINEDMSLTDFLTPRATADEPTNQNPHPPFRSLLSLVSAGSRDTVGV